MSGALAVQRWTQGEGQNFLGFTFNFSFKIHTIRNLKEVSLLQSFPEMVMYCVSPGETARSFLNLEPAFNLSEAFLQR